MNILKVIFLTAILLLAGSFVVANTVSAESKLQVGSDALILGESDNLFFGNINASSSATSSLLLLQNASSSVFRVDPTGNVVANGTITANGFSGTYTGTIGAPNVSAGYFGSNTGGGNYSFPGNVGIGTASPASKLEIKLGVGVADINFPIDTVNAFANFNRAAINRQANIGFYTTDILDWAMGTADSDNAGDGTEFYIGPSQGGANAAFWIESGGNVGIGTTAPIAKLQIKEDSTSNSIPLVLSNDDITAGNDIFILFRGIDSSSVQTNFAAIDAEMTTHTAGAITSKLNFKMPDAAGSITTKMTILSDGNVGIGTDSPGVDLEVGADNSMFAVSDGGGLTRFIALETKDDTPSISWDDGDSLVFGTKASKINSGVASEFMRIDSSGQVGIGTNNPGAKLDVGDGTSETNVIIRGGVNTANEEARLKLLEGTTTAGFEISYDGDSNLFKILSDNAGGSRNIRLAVERDSGNVGINTTTPTYKLDVNGTGQFTNTVIVATPTAGTHAATKDYVDSAAGGGVGAGTTGQTLRHDGSNWVANSVLYNNGTNVGIRTSAPASPLHIKGNGGGIRIDGYDSLPSQFWTQTTGTNTFNIKDWEGNNLFQLDGVNNYAIFPNSNVGIGTTTPAVPLSVVKSGSWAVAEFIANSYPAITVKSLGINKFAQLNIYDTRINNESTMELRGDTKHFNIRLDNTGNVFTILDTGNVGINDITPTYKLDVNGTGQFTNTVIVATPTAGTHAATKDYVDSAAGGGVSAGTTGQTLRHDGSNWVANNTIYNTGTNIGIGTTNPGQKLEVSSTTGGILRLKRDDVTVVAEDHVGTIEFYSNDADTSKVSSYIRSVARELYGREAALTFGVSQTINTDATEAMRINENGNVGIGTTNPTYKLDVTGTGRVSSSMYIGGLTYINNKGVVTWDTGEFRTYATSGNALHLGANGSYDHLIIATGGNVGIGTASPSANLHISSASSATQSIGAGVNQVATLKLLESGAGDVGSYISYDGVNNRLGVFVGNNPPVERISVLRDTGNVGINDTTPSYKLDINGTGQFTNTVIVATPTAGTHAATKDYVDSAAGGGVGAGTTGQTLRHDGSNWIANSTLFNNGTNVGVGLTNPQSLLDVSGAVKITGTISSEKLYDSLSDNLITYLPFSENTGTATKDRTSSALTGTFSGTVNWTTGKQGYGLELHGDADYLAGIPVASSFGNELTFSTWIYPDSVSGKNLAGLGSSWTQSIVLTNATTVTFNANPEYTAISLTESIQTGKWQLFTLTRDSSGNLKVYLNGKDITSGSPTNVGNLATSHLFMSKTSAPTSAWDGKVDEIMIWDRLLSAGEVRDLYRRGLGTQGPYTDLNTGRVGIGTDSPINKLQVGDNSASDFFLNFQTSNSNERGINYYLTDGVTVRGYLKWDSNEDLNIKGDNIAFNTQNNNDVMVIKDGGNVGINDITPTYKLDVNGTGRFTNTVVVATPTAGTHAATKDYVDSAAGGGVGAGITGQTLRHDGSNWIANSILYNNGTNVGIGTTDPDHLLHLEGTQPFLDFTSTGDNTEIGILFRTTGGMNKGKVSYDMVSEKLLFRSSSVGSGTDMIIDSSGNVGIGTSAPSRLFEVSDITIGGVNAIISIQAANDGQSSLFFRDVADTNVGGVLYTHSNDQMEFRVNDGTKMAIDASGNVGIGTDSPEEKLSVYGNLLFNLAPSQGGSLGSIKATYHDLATYKNAAAIDFIRNDATYGHGADIYFKTNEINGAGATTRMVIDNSGNVGIGTTHPDELLTLAVNEKLAWEYSAADNSAPFWITAGGIDPMNFYWNPGSTPTYEAFKFTTNSGDALTIMNGGNVGINDTTPSYKLDVNGTGQFTNTVIVATPTAGTHAATKDYVDSAAGGGVGAGTTGQTLRHDGSNWVANSILFNNGTNVGIGIASPATRLDIDSGSNTAGLRIRGLAETAEIGDIYIGAGGAMVISTVAGTNIHNYLDLRPKSTDYGLILRESDGTSASAYANMYVTNAASNYLSINVNSVNDADALVVTQGNKVGIGTATPSEKLEVNGAIRSNGGATANTANSVSMSSETGTADGYFMSVGDATTRGTYIFNQRESDAGSSNSAIEIQSDGDVLLAQSNGNVGIGTASPQQELHIADTSAPYMKFSTDTTGHTASDGTNIGIDTDGDLAILNYESKNINFYTSTSQRMTILSGGNVGINDSTPTYKLDVNGTGQFTNTVIVATPTAGTHAATKDYVDSQSGGGLTGSGTTNYMTKWTGTTALGNSVIYDNGTSVGIGTASPQEKVHIKTTGTSVWQRMEQDAQAWEIGIKADEVFAIRDNTGGNIDVLSIEKAAPATIRIDSAGNVGIGTSNPGAKLEVNNTIKFTGTGNGNAGLIDFGTGYGSPALYLYNGGVGARYGWGLNSNEMQFFIPSGSRRYTWNAGGDFQATGVNELMRLTSEGNVGIGTTAPLQPLQVGTEASISEGVIRTASRNSGGGTRAWDFGASATLYPYGFFIKDDNMADPSFFIQHTTGNVGINDITPSYKLDVNGTGRFVNTVIVATPTAGTHAATKDYVDSQSGGGLTGSGTANYMTKWTGTTAIGNSAIYNNGANVGIGTTNPLKPLHIATTDTNNGMLLETTDTVEGRIGFDLKTGYTANAGDFFRFNFRGDLANVVQTVYDDSTASWKQLLSFNYLTDQLFFGNPSSVVFDYSSGNVGIGTDSPGTLLNVVGSYDLDNGTLRLAGDDHASGFAGLTLYNDYSSPSASSRNWRMMVGRTTAGYLQFDVSADNTGSPEDGLTAMTLDSSGNVGIGTDSPAEGLDIAILNSGLRISDANDGNNIRATIQSSTGNGGFFEMYDSSEVKNVLIRSYGDSYFSGGNVGINDSTPTYKLDVNGTGRFVNTVIVATPTAGTHAATKDYVDSQSGGGLTGSGTANYMTKWTGTTVLGNSVIYDNGTNVGIGTTSPSQLLYVTANAVEPKIVIHNTGGVGGAAFQFIDDLSSSNFKFKAISTGGFKIRDANAGTNVFSIENGAASDSLYIDSAGNVGIGTTAPGVKFEVQGSLETNDRLTITDAADTGGNIRFSAANPYIYASSYTVMPGGLYVSGGTLYVANQMRARGGIYNDAGAYLTIAGGNTGVSYFTGNVGIQDTTPSYDLDVNGTGRFTSTVIVATPTAGTHAATKDYVDSQSGGGLTGSGTANYMTKWTGTTVLGNSVIYDNGINVGIGTTAPNELLNIKQTTDDFTSIHLENTNAGTGAGSQIQIENNLNDTLFILNHGGGRTVARYGLTMGSWGEILYQDASTNGLVLGTGNADNPIVFGSNNLERMRINTGGNVGIGTTAPLSVLHIGNTDYADISDGLSFGDGDTGFYESADDTLRITAGAVDRFFWSGVEYRGVATLAPSMVNETPSATNPVFAFAGDLDTGIGRNGADQLSLIAGATELVRLTEDTANKITFNAPMFVLEQAAANADVATFGQLWVKNTTPNELWFTDDAGTDFQLGAGLTNPMTTQGDVIYGGASGVPTRLAKGTATQVLTMNAGATAPEWADAGGGASLPSGSASQTLRHNGSAWIANSVIFNNGTNVGIGDSTPGAKLSVTGDVDVSGTLTANKLTVNTIDPLYKLNGINYSTFASSIVGGVKEEYIGRIKIDEETIIDFDEVEEGSDLWVWREVVDFNKDNVDILITPYGQFAEVYYIVEDNKIIFRSDRSVEVSYRLVAKRLDWREWPTKALDQSIQGWEIK